MNKEISELEPKGIWKNFAALNAIPRPSKKEEKIREFLLDFGKVLQLETLEDSTGNVLIKKEATPGMQNKKTVVLQAHMDMVVQKNKGVEHDFDTQGIAMYVDGDWVKAKGTTLGADNGLGVATILHVLESDDLEHPAIEALFTYDEEAGMTGALNLDKDILQGEILLNLDTEEDDEIDIGCAGGIDITATKLYEVQEVPKDYTAYELNLSGLQGGHSGMDIHMGFGNANKLINRILYAGFQAGTFQISSIDGGGLRNAIPRESSVLLVVKDRAEAIQKVLQREMEWVKEEYEKIEKELTLSLRAVPTPQKAMGVAETKNLIHTLYASFNGVYRMSPDIQDLVETSNNVARVEAIDGKIEILCLTRSSIESGKRDLTRALLSTFDLGGFEVQTSGEYPGWQPNTDSAILAVAQQVYVRQNDREPRVVACHAGLECGVLLDHYPQLDAISLGPTIKGAHSPDERASIASTQKFWKWLKEVLKNIPDKK